MSYSLHCTRNRQGRDTISDKHLAYCSSRRLIRSVLQRPLLDGDRSTVHKNPIARNVTSTLNDFTLAKICRRFCPPSAMPRIKRTIFPVRSPSPMFPTTVTCTPARNDGFMRDSQLYCQQISSDGNVAHPGHTTHTGSF